MCASHKRQHSSARPTRELTRLSARAAAFCLAQHDNAECLICPTIRQKFLPDSDPARRPGIEETLGQITQHLDNSAASESGVAKDSSAKWLRKDPKSLPQHLLDTEAVRRLLRPDIPPDTHFRRDEIVGRVINTEQGLRSYYRQTKHLLVEAGGYRDELLTQINLQRAVGLIAGGASALADYMQKREYDWRNDLAYGDDIVLMKLIASLAAAIAVEARPDSPLASLTAQAIAKRCGQSDQSMWLRRCLQTYFLNVWDSKPTIAIGTSASYALSALYVVADAFEEEMITILGNTYTHPTLCSPTILINHALKFWKQSGSNSSSNSSSANSDGRHGPVTIGGKMCVTEVPFPLLGDGYIVRVFRGICLDRMREAIDESLLNTKMLHRGFKDLRDPQGRQMPPQVSSLQRGRLAPAMTITLQIQVRRDHLLSDFYDELWRRQKRDLLRPLRIRLVSEWEIGNDQGGVSQEVLRLAIAEVLQPSHGMFSLDEESRMMWFNGSSLEPLYKFELAGLLVALGVHNGYNMPLSFPEALYRRLLGKATHAVHLISDGWPALHRGLEQLEQYDDNDLEATFSLDWTFSTLRLDGTTEAIDMLQALPSYSSLVAAADELQKNELSATHPVTRRNRDLYIEAYLEMLTYESVKPQIEAFAEGFHTILPPAVLRTTTPETLESLVQGVYDDIDTQKLQRGAQYPDEIYTADSKYIRGFWSIVHDLPQDRKKKLLEFVTASDRVPVTGNVMFKIEKSFDEEKLPTSHTCFGILRLPEYASRETLETKLNIALDNAEGFGIL